MARCVSEVTGKSPRGRAESYLTWQLQSGGGAAPWRQGQEQFCGRQKPAGRALSRGRGELQAKTLGIFLHI